MWNQLKRKQPADQRFAILAELAVDAAQARCREKDAVAVRSLRQMITGSQKPMTDEKFLTAKLGAMLPALSTEPVSVILRQLHNRSMTALPAGAALPPLLFP
jgi:hypothetical protein